MNSTSEWFEKVDSHPLLGGRVELVGECIEWQGNRAVSGGYGRLRVDHVLDFTHRWSYRWLVGEIPDGMFVLHSCDNPPCINPGHLRVGSPADNAADMARRGRSTRGQAFNYKLDDEDIEEIKRRYWSNGLHGMHHRGNMNDLASEFGVTPRTIFRIAKEGRHAARL